MAAHEWAAASHDLDKSLIAAAQPGDTVRFLYHVGSGGGHELHISGFNAKLQFSQPSVESVAIQLLQKPL